MADGLAMIGGICYLYAVAIMMLFCGIYCHKWSSEASDLLTYPTGFMNQVAADWQSPPLTDIQVTTNTYCPTDAQTIVFGRHWYGSNIGCDCLGIYSEWITGQNSMVRGAECTYNQTRYGCDQVYPLTPVRQAQINGMRVCGSTKATPFVNATRP